MEMFRIENFSFTYPQAARAAVQHVDLEIRRGEFLLLCGRSGCGKTTLLRQLKREIAPHGRREGRIEFCGTALGELAQRESAARIGFVSQNPDNQIVCDKVYHELAFGLESLGCPTEVIRRRVAEISSFLGISQWFRRDVGQLSGGQKQMLNLAAVMVMHPEVLILDEPTSQLDPIAATEFIETLKKINADLGMTIVLSEHRLEDVFPVADRVLVMEDGKLVCACAPREVPKQLKRCGAAADMEAGLPSAMRIFTGCGADGACPVTPKEGRMWLGSVIALDAPRPKRPTAAPPVKDNRTPALRLREVWFRYEKGMADVLRGVHLSAYAGEILCVLGGNGTGKSTTLGVCAGNLRPYRGTVEIGGKKLRDYKNGELYRGGVALLPQSPQSLFVHDTVGGDLADAAADMEGGAERVREAAALLGIEHLTGAHPFDLSGGEQQKAAFAKLWLRRPRVLLLDEPTKGLDAAFKAEFAQILRRLAKEGACIVIATHDIEFSAEFADRCALFFDGSVISEDRPAPFFAGNSYYTTSANRIARHICPEAITCKDVIELCKSCKKTDA